MCECVCVRVVFPSALWYVLLLLLCVFLCTVSCSFSQPKHKNAARLAQESRGRGMRQRGGEQEDWGAEGITRGEMGQFNASWMCRGASYHFPSQLLRCTCNGFNCCNCHSFCCNFCCGCCYHWCCLNLLLLSSSTFGSLLSGLCRSQLTSSSPVLQLRSLSLVSHY